MAEDKINVNVAHQTSNFELDEPEAIHSVGASHLKEYLATFVGEDIPRGENTTKLADDLFESLTALSTDEELPRVLAEAPSRYLPHWLRLMTPLVNSAQDIDMYLGEELAPAGDSREVEDILTDDIIYMLGILDISTFIIADQLELEHPRLRHKSLIERAKKLTPEGYRPINDFSDGRTGGLELLLRLPLVETDHKRALLELRNIGRAIINNTDSHIETVRSLIINNSEEEL